MTILIMMTASCVIVTVRVDGEFLLRLFREFGGTETETFGTTAFEYLSYTESCTLSIQIYICLYLW